MKIYEITQPRAETIVLEDLEGIQNTINNIMSRHGLPTVHIIGHVKDRVEKGRYPNDPTKTVTDNEAGLLLSKALIKHGDEISQMPDNTQVTIQGKDTKINMPTAVRKLSDGSTKVMVKTIQRKDNFKTHPGDIVYQI